MDRPGELVEIDLAEDERNLLAQGVLQLAGPSALDDVISRAIGYRDTAELLSRWKDLFDALQAGDPLTREDWRRAQVATEVSLGSEFYGAGTEWETCSGFDDASSIKMLRQIQRKLIATVGRARRASHPT